MGYTYVLVCHDFSLFGAWLSDVFSGSWLSANRLEHMRAITVARASFGTPSRDTTRFIIPMTYHKVVAPSKKKSHVMFN